VKTVRTRLEVAGRKFQATQAVATRFARTSMREVTGAVRASREPMTALWRNVRLASRHIVREEFLKLPLAHRARRPAA
jgi:hypothetical protein